MSKPWQDCIVTLLDVAGITSLAQKGEARASIMMRNLHSLARDEMRRGMLHHDTCYCYNDSVLLLAIWDGKLSSASRVLGEASGMKRRIDEEIHKSYGIAIKGRIFPIDYAAAQDSRCVVLRSSSYAMANCFLVEKRAKELGLRDDWYLDSRLAGAAAKNNARSFAMDLLPHGKSRPILRLNGYLRSPANWERVDGPSL